MAERDLSAVVDKPDCQTLSQELARVPPPPSPLSRCLGIFSQAQHCHSAAVSFLCSQLLATRLGLTLLPPAICMPAHMLCYSGNICFANHGLYQALNCVLTGVQIALWDFDVLAVDRLSGQRPLRAVLMHILDVEGLLVRPYTHALTSYL